LVCGCLGKGTLTISLAHLGFCKIFRCPTILFHQTAKYQRRSVIHFKNGIEIPFGQSPQFGVHQTELQFFRRSRRSDRGMKQETHSVPVSVVIPCYRCAATLERAVASVAAQTETPAELILVDDCSGDDTVAMVQTIADRYATGWIRTVLLQQNMGAGSARNAGWAIATQTYIAFLDSDDAWHPEKISIQLSYMLAHPEVVLSGHAHKILPNTGALDWSIGNCSGGTEAERLSRWSLLLSNRFVTPSAMLKRDIPQRFEEGQRYMEDHMLWLNIVYSGALVYRLPVPLAAIFKRPFGQAGLSAQWWLMERGDLGNYRRLLVRRNISRPLFLAVSIYSCVKFLRRVVIMNLFIRGKRLM